MLKANKPRDGCDGCDGENDTVKQPSQSLRPSRREAGSTTFRAPVPIEKSAEFEMDVGRRL